MVRVMGPIRSRFFLTKIPTPAVIAATAAYNANRTSSNTENIEPRSKATAREAEASSIMPAASSSRYSDSSDCMRPIIGTDKRGAASIVTVRYNGDIRRQEVVPWRGGLHECAGGRL